MAKVIFLVLVVFAALFVIAIKFLPWWVSLLLVLAIVLGIRFGTGYLLKRLLTLPFKAKGKALAGATVDVHTVELAALPVRKRISEDEDDVYLRDEQAEDRQLTWYFLDLTITPKGKTEGFKFWEPGELLFVGMDAKPNDLEDEVAGKLHDYQIFIEGAFQADDIGKHEGSLRVKFHVGLPPAMKQVQIRYYFELFGNIKLPGG